MPPDDQKTIDWQNDPDFKQLPLAEKHKVLLQVDPDYKGLPAKEQAKALDAIHYGSLGQISGSGDLTGAGTAAGSTIKGMFPDPTGGHPLLSTAAWLGTPRIMSNEESGIGQMAQEGSAEYQRARDAGTNPLAAGYSAAISGAGPLVGISDLQQQKLAKQGETGQIFGQSAVPLAATIAGPFVGRALGRLPRTTPLPTEGGAGFSPEVTGAIGKKIGSAAGPLGGWVGEKIGRRFGTPGAVEGTTADSFSKQQRMAAYAEMNKDFAKSAKEATKAQAKADSAAQKSAAKVPPNPFEGMTSTAPGAVPTGATLPEVPQGQPTPFPTIARKGGVSAPPTTEEAPPTGGPLDMPTQPAGKTSLLSRGRTLVQPGMEPDMTNPTHVKMVNDYQTMSGPALRQLAAAGDRFAAFVLRHMPRP